MELERAGGLIEQEQDWRRVGKNGGGTQPVMDLRATSLVLLRQCETSIIMRALDSVGGNQGETGLKRTPALSSLSYCFPLSPKAFKVVGSLNFRGKTWNDRGFPIYSCHWRPDQPIMSA